MNSKNREVKYLNRDFSSNKEALINFAKTYFPDTYNDFNPESIGMMFIEMSAYIGDVLSLYNDNQLQEIFPQHSRILENLYKHSYIRGYEPKISTPSISEVEIYQVVNALNGEPDYGNVINVPENTQVSANYDSSIKFFISEPVDFTYSSSIDPTEVDILEVNDQDPPIPLKFLLKKYRKAISSKIVSKEFTFTEFKRFNSIEINDENIIGILDIYDSDNNQWYEVKNLASDLIYDYIENTNKNQPGEPLYILDVKSTQYRFTTRHLNKGSLRVEFGSGNINDYVENNLPNPYTLNPGIVGFDYSDFLKSDTYGISPHNTTLTVRYLSGGGIKSNIPQDTLTDIGIEGIYCNNPKASTGGGNGDNVNDLRIKMMNTFSSQDRAVTPADYISKCLNMPSMLGSISKVFVEPEKLINRNEGIPSVLDLYVLSYDYNKNLTISSDTLKENLYNYLAQYRMINDFPDIKNAFIVNIGVNFDIIIKPNYNTGEVIFKCIEEVKNFFNIDRWQINQPIILKELYIILDQVEGVLTVNNIDIINLTGLGGELDYSPYEYNIDEARINDVIYPSIDPMIFEIKFPSRDIKGRSSNF